jgi:hypothetical protein
MPGDGETISNDLVTPPRCSFCGYDRAGLESASPCPECGRITPENTLVPDRVRCVTCSYPLAGLPIVGLCPECGARIEASMRGMPLEQRDAAYLRRLHIGARRVCHAMLAWLVAVVGGFAVQVAGQAAGPGGGAGVLWWANRIWNVAGGWVLVGIALLFLRGWFLLTSPDAGMPRETAGERPRRLARFSAVAVGGLLLVFELLTTILHGAMPGPAWAAGTMRAGELAGLASLVFALMLYVAGLLYLRELALRIPSLRLRSMAGVWVWLCPLIAVLGACVFFAGPLLAAALYFVLMNRTAAELGAVRRAVDRAQRSEAGVASV